ncbi:hypothetical protein O5559_28110, partial [Escherichia coli]|nr:hypothetical protein [Escherichia coli]
SALKEQDIIPPESWIGTGVIFMILRYFFIGESAMWAARVGRYQEACDIQGKRYGVQARVGDVGAVRRKAISSARWGRTGDCRQ